MPLSYPRGALLTFGLSISGNTSAAEPLEGLRRVQTHLCISVLTEGLFISPTSTVWIVKGQRPKSLSPLFSLLEVLKNCFNTFILQKQAPYSLLAVD